MDLVTEARMGSIVRITLCRPEKRNALDHNLANAALQALESAFSDPSVAVVTLHGAGGTLSAGADLSDPAAVERSMRNYPAEPQARLLRTVRSSPVPVVAAVDGYALGAGMGLAGAATLVVATRRSTFGLPEARMGFFPFGVVPYLTDRSATHTVLEWALSGRRFDALEAHQAGVVTHLTTEEAFDETVADLTAALSTAPSDIVRSGMEWYRRNRDSAPPDEMITFCESAIGHQPAPGGADR